jgi:nucleotide-binding universal stress UspA family protein
MHYRPGMTVLRSILVPTDGSAPSLAALDHALGLAEDYQARIEVLEVEPGKVITPVVRGDIVDDAIARARTTLQERLSHRIVDGDPIRRIVEVAAEGFDLIVMGTHGRVGRLHALLGSVAEGVVRNAPCPVLTVRDPGDGYQSFSDSRHHRPTLSDQVTHEGGDSSDGTEAVVAFTGTQVGAEVMHMMLLARGINAKVTRDHEIEGGTAIIEAVIFVPPEQAEEARALILDTESGAAELA